jgi:hypothetical protein
MARLDPRLWGEKRQIDANVQTSNMTPEQREALVQGMLKRLEIVARPALEERKRLEAQQAKVVDVTPKPEPAPDPLPAGAAPYRAALPGTIARPPTEP